MSVQHYYVYWSTGFQIGIITAMLPKAAYWGIDGGTDVGRNLMIHCPAGATQAQQTKAGTPCGRVIASRHQFQPTCKPDHAKI